MATQFLVSVEHPNGLTELVYAASDQSKVDDDTSLGDTAVMASRLKYPGAFCSLRLDNRGKQVKRDR